MWRNDGGPSRRRSDTGARNAHACRETGRTDGARSRSTGPDGTGPADPHSPGARTEDQRHVV
jgi:hypothetical protein